MSLTISFNALVGITTPQTLKIEGYINKKKVIVLIDLGCADNFIHCKVAKEFELFPIPSTRMSSDGCKWRNYKFLWKMP